MATRLELMTELTGIDASRMDQLATHLAGANRAFASGGFGSLATRGALSPPQFYSYYPLLFEPLFPHLREHDIEGLVTASHFLSYWCFITDNLLDEEPGSDAGHQLMSSVLLVTAKDSFRQLFPDCRARFWGQLQAVQRDFITAMLQEAGQTMADPADISQAEASAAMRSACAKAIPLAMALLSGSEEPIPALIRSHDLLAVGRQLLDDLDDWREDMQRGAASYALRLATRLVECGEAADLEEAMAGPVARHLTERASSAFAEAERALPPSPESGWSRWVHLLGAEAVRRHGSLFPYLSTKTRAVPNPSMAP